MVIGASINEMSFRMTGTHRGSLPPSRMVPPRRGAAIIARRFQRREHGDLDYPRAEGTVDFFPRTTIFGSDIQPPLRGSNPNTDFPAINRRAIIGVFLRDKSILAYGVKQSVPGRVHPKTAKNPYNSSRCLQ